MNRPPRPSILPLALLALLAVPRAGADPYADQVRGYLADRYSYWRYSGSGWEALPELRVLDVLLQGQSLTLGYTLVGGRTYRLLGACDNDCLNLDLNLRAADGTLVATDIAPDDLPMLELKPARTGDYTLTVTVVRCKNPGGCEFGVDLYRAP